ncbi:MAG: hypothetical protein NVS2B8_18770 [Vulcanimicrobiaceae bacterium]
MKQSRRPADLRFVALGATGAMLLGLYLGLAASSTAGLSPFANRTDTLAFYCGARVAAAGGDPYRAEPLRTCEHTAMRSVGIEPIAVLVVPAPLPGYAFALLRPLAAAPYRIALALWYVVLVLAVAATAALLRRLTRLPMFAIVVALAGADLYASVTLGQTVPLVLLGVVASAAALRAGHERRAACLLGLAMLEPHVGVPAMLALALVVPRARGALAGIAVVLAMLSIASVGVARNVEYIVAALPAQARGEGLEFHRQYSLSALLATAGLPDEAAVRAGSLSYAFALAFGLALARRARFAFDDPAMLVFVPVTTALVGGAYAHIAQMAVALPLALVVVASTRGTSRRCAVAATVCLAIPWQTILSEPAIVALFPAAPYVDPAPLLARVSEGSRLASDAWNAWIATIGNRDHRTSLEVLVGKLPTWFGLLGLLALVTRRAMSRESVALPSIASESTTTRTLRRGRSIRSN